MRGSARGGATRSEIAKEKRERCQGVPRCRGSVSVIVLGVGYCDDCNAQRLEALEAGLLAEAKRILDRDVSGGNE